VTLAFSVPEFRDGQVRIRLPFHLTQFTASFKRFGFVGNILASWNEKRLIIKPLYFKPHKSIHTNIRFIYK
jgi:hypothetical protein